MNKLTITFILFVFSYAKVFAQEFESQIAVDSTKFSEQVTVDLTVNAGDSISFGLLDVTGRTLVSFKKSPLYESNEFELVIDTLPNGMYVAVTEVNTERMLNKLIRTRATHNTALKAIVNLNIQVRQEAETLLVYPNPSTSSKLTISAKSTASTIKINIYSLEGKKLLTQYFNNLTGILIQQIDIATLSQGIYLIEMHTPKGSASQKFVKN